MVTSVAVAGRVLDLWAPAGVSSAAAATAGAGLGSGRAGRTLVVVELGGGNDGLNTVVPHADPRVPRAAADARGAPTRSISTARSASTRGSRKLAERYRAGQVAIVEGVGYPDPDLSHFASMAVWWSADPEQRSGTGWLGRYLDGTVGFDDPLAGVVIGTGPSPALLGERSFATTIADSDRSAAAVAGLDRPAGGSRGGVVEVRAGARLDEDARRPGRERGAPDGRGPHEARP